MIHIFFIEFGANGGQNKKNSKLRFFFRRVLIVFCDFVHIWLIFMVLSRIIKKMKKMRKDRFSPYGFVWRKFDRRSCFLRAKRPSRVLSTCWHIIMLACHHAGISSCTFGNLWQPLATFGNPWKCMQMYENVSKCEQMYANVLKCEQIFANVYKCMQMWANVDRLFYAPPHVRSSLLCPPPRQMLDFYNF